jgi:hypothetical protein
VAAQAQRGSLFPQDRLNPLIQIVQLPQQIVLADLNLVQKGIAVRDFQHGRRADASE